MSTVRVATSQVPVLVGACLQTSVAYATPDSTDVISRDINCLLRVELGGQTLSPIFVIPEGMVPHLVEALEAWMVNRSEEAHFHVNLLGASPAED